MAGRPMLNRPVAHISLTSLKERPRIGLGSITVYHIPFAVLPKVQGLVSYELDADTILQALTLQVKPQQRHLRGLPNKARHRQPCISPQTLVSRWPSRQGFLTCSQSCLSNKDVIKRWWGKGLHIKMEMEGGRLSPCPACNPFLARKMMTTPWPGRPAQGSCEI